MVGGGRSAVRWRRWGRLGRGGWWPRGGGVCGGGFGRVGGVGGRGRCCKVDWRCGDRLTRACVDEYGVAAWRERVAAAEGAWAQADLEREAALGRHPDAAPAHAWLAVAVEDRTLESLQGPGIEAAAAYLKVALAAVGRIACD